MSVSRGSGGRRRTWGVPWALFVAGALGLAVLAPAPLALGAWTTAQRNEAIRYAWETDDLTYATFMDRKADFTKAGCNRDDRRFGKCTKPWPYNTFVWTTDGCSAPIRYGAYRAIFAGPCEQHDFAYRNIGNGLSLDRSNSARRRIDKKLYIEARRACNEKYRSRWRIVNRAACLREADEMYSFFMLPAWGPPKGPENWDKPCAKGKCWPPVIEDPAPVATPTNPTPTTPVQVPTPTATTPTTTTPKPTTPPPPPRTWPETAGGVAHTWTNHTNAGGTQGPSIAAGQTVQITCRLQGFRVADGNTWWYRIAESPWSNRYYVSADAFYNNGATSGSLHGTPFVDEKVATC